MAKNIVVKALVEGGKASPAPLSQQLSQHKLNIGQAIAAINEKTKDFSGIQVPVEITIKPDKSFDIKVGTPPVSSLIKKELGLQKLAKMPGKESIGNVSFEQVVKIAKAKMDSLGTSDIKSVVKQVVGTCVSLGVTIEGKPPKEITKEIDSGALDDKIK